MSWVKKQNFKELKELFKNFRELSFARTEAAVENILVWAKKVSLGLLASILNRYTLSFSLLGICDSPMSPN